MLFAVSMAVANKVAYVLGGGITMIVFIGLGLLIARGGGADAIWEDMKRPLSRLAEARAGQIVRVKGVAQPGPRGPDPALFSGVPSVYHMTSAEFEGRKGLHGIETLKRDYFVVVDGAWILLDANFQIAVYGTEHWWTTQSFVAPSTGIVVHDLQPAQREIIEARLQKGLTAKAAVETRIVAGDEIEVIGTIQQRPNGYAFGPANGGEIRVLAGPVGDLGARVQVRRMLGFGFIAAGVVVGIVCGVLTVV